MLRSSEARSRGQVGRLGVAGLLVWAACTPFLGSPADAATQATVTLTNDGTSADSDYTITMTLGAALDDSGRITAVAPAGTDFASCAAYVTDETDPADSGGAYCNTGSNRNTVIINPYNPIRGAHRLSIKVSGVVNPSSPVSPASLAISTTAEPTAVNSAPYAVVSRSVSEVSVVAQNASPGAESNYTLKLRTSPSGSLRADGPRKITVVGPNGYDFGGCSATITDMTDAAGSGGAYCSTGANRNTMIISTYNAVGANHQLSIALTGIGNPTVADPAYVWRLTTSSDQTPVNSAPFAIGSASNPSPSPSPGATSPSHDAPPTVSVSPGVISAGETVTASYRGTPGATFDILSRTQPATVFSRIGSVTLDSNGVGFSSHRPQKNTRITARSAGGTVSDTQPIIAVRSVASFNVNRVGTRTVTFTGRVYPALNQRLVNVYRNGSLVAQARCDASGIYKVTRTLGGGTYTFQARTANDQYNLGTTSLARQVTIY